VGVGGGGGGWGGGLTRNLSRTHLDTVAAQIEKLLRSGAQCLLSEEQDACATAFGQYIYVCVCAYR